ncbi:MAG: hypothetical protein FJY95_05000 [Candidatus Handelsmanbacteria bacterium]|nr:hypothetical protein [Candidatus Handelsmanbacteria bacterium]
MSGCRKPPCTPSESRRAIAPARTPFLAGARDFGDGRYAEAAGHYQQSLDLHPALLDAAQFSQAGELLQRGLQQAHRQKWGDYKAAFRANLGVLGLH